MVVRLEEFHGCSVGAFAFVSMTSACSSPRQTGAVQQGVKGEVRLLFQEGRMACDDKSRILTTMTIMMSL